MLCYYTHVVYGIDKWIVTAITHSEPVETEPYDVDIRIPESKHIIFHFFYVGPFFDYFAENKNEEDVCKMRLVKLSSNNMPRKFLVQKVTFNNISI